MFSTSEDEARRYAPLWIAMFSAGSAVARAVAERVLLRRTWSLKWKDLVTAMGGAVIGYLIFRKRRGNVEKGLFTR